MNPSWIAFKFCCCYLVTQSFPTLGIPWTVACQASLSLGFPRQEYWSEVPFPSPGDLADSGIKPMSPALQVDLYHWATSEAHNHVNPNTTLKCTVDVFFFFLWRRALERPTSISATMSHGPALPCPLSVWWTFSLMDISSPRHHLLPTNRSLYCPFFPITTPMSSSLLSTKLNYN